MAEMAEAEKAWPHSSSVIVLTPASRGQALPGRDALHVHLGQRRHEPLLGALVALEKLGRDPAVPVLRQAQLELADPCDQGARIVAGAVAEPCRGALALLGADASVISASSSSCITARTISRSPSGLCEKRALTAAIAG
jgi:hypothetical protein